MIDLFHSVASYNGTNGLAAGGTAGIIRYADTAIFGNVTGVNPGSGTIASFTPATNPNVDNATNGTPNGSSVAAINAACACEDRGSRGHRGFHLACALVGAG